MHQSSNRAPHQNPAAPAGRSTRVDELAAWAEQQIAAQVYRPGTRMPSVRQLAAQRGVSRFTVVETYERLVARGLLLARPGAGFFVREPVARRERRTAAPARSAQPVNVAWLVRNMLNGLPAERSPGFGALPPALCGGELVRAGLRAASLLPLAQLSRGEAAQGYLPFREQLVRRLASIEVAATPAQLLTTSGCTQAFSLIAAHLLKPSDAVLVGDPSWYAQLGALALSGVRVVGVPYTEHGPDLQAMAALAAQHKPRLLLINSALHNPTGTVLSLASAHRILRLAEQHDMLIAEDDVWADFVPDAAAAPRLASLDQLQRVIYFSSFSKMLAPGLRVGYIAAQPALIEALLLHKLLASWASSELLERVLLHALTEGSYRRHCQRVRARLDALREPTFARLEPLGLRLLGRPQAGYLGWFDAGVDTTVLASQALDAGYLLAPGALFSPTQTPSTWLRMNIATCQDAGLLAWLGPALAALRRG